MIRINPFNYKSCIIRSLKKMMKMIGHEFEAICARWRRTALGVSGRIGVNAPNAVGSAPDTGSSSNCPPWEVVFVMPRRRWR